MARWPRRAPILASVLLSACAILSPPIPNPTGLPSDALTLEYVKDQ